MKKILLIVSRIPYPPTSGDKLKSFNLLKILSKSFDVHLVVITDESLNKDTSFILNKYTTKTKVFTKNKYLFYFNATRVLFNYEPLQVGYYYFKDVQKYVDIHLCDSSFVISTLVRTTKYLENYNGLKYFDVVDSIAISYKNSLKNVNSLFWRMIYKFEIKRLFKYEKKCISEFSNSFFVNKFECDYWSKYGKTTWIPNGVNYDLLSYDKCNNQYLRDIVFFGKMNYQPNIDAVLWFVNNVLESINKNIKLIIVGSFPAPSISALADQYENIQVTGFLDDPYEIIYSSLLVVSPMQTGGGMQNKVLESMALGKLNIVSKLAADPIIGANNGEHFLVLDHPNEIARVINDAYLGEYKYQDICNNAKELISNKYTWGLYEDKLLANVINIE
jgi:hypothetical protein